MTNDKKTEALKQIEQMSDSGSYEDTIVRMKSIATEALKLAAQPKQEAITHYHVADNSDGFREWLQQNKIQFISNGHFTSIPLEGNDIFRIGAEFALYRQGKMKDCKKEPESTQGDAVELKNILRELIMRGNYGFPMNEQDLEWFETGIKGKTKDGADFLIRLFELSGIEAEARKQDEEDL